VKSEDAVSEKMSSGTEHLFSIPDNWTFKSPEVAAAFDAHVREQLPWYDLATGLVSHVARHYIPERGHVVDVGASTGNVGRAIDATLHARRASFQPIDASPDMLEKYRGPGELKIVDVRDHDFRDPVRPDLIIAFLVLMFIPVADRADVVRRMMSAVRPGGAVLVFDKLATRGGHVGSVVYRLTLAAKYEAGATPDEIIRKELSLAGVQRPIEEMELPGFVPIFRFGDFAGFLFEKGPDGG